MQPVYIYSIKIYIVTVFTDVLLQSGIIVGIKLSDRYLVKLLFFVPHVLNCLKPKNTTMKKLFLFTLATFFALNTATLSARPVKDGAKKALRENRKEERKLRRKAEKKEAQTEKMLKEEHKREVRREAQIRKDATKNSTSSVEHHKEN